MDTKLKEGLEYTVKRVDAQIDHLIPKGSELETKLFDAMRYSTLVGGKRVRAFLILTTAKLFGVDEARALRVAAAVECAHAYSLAHDDLPCMDDAKLRRGRPALHCEFDEATAVLCGDALQSLAFEIIADEDTHADSRVRIKLIQSLAKALGPRGMAGGQMIDMLGESQDLTIGAITRLNRLKTGAMFQFCCEVGPIMGRGSPKHFMALRNYANDFGQAYQMTDDLLDHYGVRQDTGKDTKLDAKAGKSNFIKALGAEETKQKATLLVNQAVDHLAVFKGQDDAEKLVLLVQYLLERKK